MSIIAAFNTQADPKTKHLQVTKTSNKGSYIAVISIPSNSVPLNTIHSWGLEIINTNTGSLENEKIIISVDMPDHNHGMPTTPSLSLKQDSAHSSQSNKKYTIDGLKFQMYGLWRIRFEIVNIEQTEEITFFLDIKPTGLVTSQWTTPAKAYLK